MQPSQDQGSSSSTATSTRKIKVRESATRTVGVYSVLFALAAAVVAFLAWRTWHSAPPREGYVRRADEVQFTWLCANQHRFTAAGRSGPRSCPVCNASAYVLETYVCPSHGRFEVLGEFADAPGDGAPTIARLKAAGGEWRSAEDKPACPVCGQAMTWLRDDPIVDLDAARRGRE